MSDADQIACAMWDLEEQRDDLLAALKAVEWPRYDDCGENFCVCCGALKSQGHASECLVGNAIAKAEGGE